MPSDLPAPTVDLIAPATTAAAGPAFERAGTPPVHVGRPPIAARDLVAGLDKGLQVIEAFDQERPFLSIAEVARRAGLSRAAARRYLLTLAHLGYVHHDGRQFSLNARVLRLGQSYMHSSRLPRVLQPALRKLALALQEGSSAGVLDRDDVISVAASAGGRVVSATLQPGSRVPAYCTANGRVLVAALPADEAAAWVERQTLEPRTPHTLLRRDQLLAQIEQIRASGHALVDQEFELGLRTLSVPLRNWRGDTVAALNISAHAARMKPAEMLERGLPLLLQTQGQLRQLL